MHVYSLQTKADLAQMEPISRYHVHEYPDVNRVGRFKCEYGPDTLSKGWGTSIKTRNYTRPGSCIKTALPQATVFSLGPVNWGVVYPTVLS